MPTPLGESLPLKSPPVLGRDHTILPLHIAQHKQDAARGSTKSLLPPDTHLEDIPLTNYPTDNHKTSSQHSLDTRRSHRPPSLHVHSPSTDRKGPAFPTSDTTTLEGHHHHLRTPRTPMGKKPSPTKSQNGHTTGVMSPFVDARRKNASLDGVSSTGAYSDRYSLDDPVPETPKTPSGGASAGFWELAPAERRNFLMLCLLYFMQGVPMGLATGSVPFLLKSHLSFGQIGVFSLASYPYSLKLLWSPIVDAVWSQRVGRRKSWIVPIQALSGVGMLWLGRRVEAMMVSAGENDGAGVWGFTSWWFFLVFMCATQDIAVDGMVLHSPSSKATSLTAFRLGSGPPLSTKSLLCLDCANCWSHCWPVSLIHSLPCI